MFSALADDDNTEIKKSLHKFVAMSPCAIFNTADMDESFFSNGLYKFPEVGVHSLYGPDWEKNLQTICSEFRPEVCDQYKLPGQQPTSAINLRHWVTNGF